MNSAKTPNHDPHLTKGSKKSKKPKRNISAFHIYSKEMHAKLNEAHDKINPNKRMSLISEMWANLPPNEKNHYIELAKMDKWRYLNELNEFYANETEMAPVENKSKPKKFGNAFTFFLREKRETLRESQPQLSMSEIMSLVAKEWRGLGKAEKQKYVDASEEDKKRYKKEVCEMTQKAKPAKSNAKKKLLKNVQNFEKTIGDFTQNSKDTNQGQAKVYLKKQNSNTAKNIQDPRYGASFRLTKTGSSRQNSFFDWLPKIEAREKSQDSIPFPKLEYGDSITDKPSKEAEMKIPNLPSKRNTSFTRNDSFDLFNFGSKNNASFVLPNLPSLASNIQLSFANGNSVFPNATGGNQATSGNEAPTSKGRNFLNGVLSNTLNSDGGLTSLNDLLGIEPNFSMDKSVDKDFFS